MMITNEMMKCELKEEKEHSIAEGKKLLRISQQDNQKTLEQQLDSFIDCEDDDILYIEGEDILLSVRFEKTESKIHPDYIFDIKQNVINTIILLLAIEKNPPKESFKEFIKGFGQKVVQCVQKLSDIPETPEYKSSKIESTVTNTRKCEICGSSLDPATGRCTDELCTKVKDAVDTYYKKINGVVGDDYT